MRDFDPSAYMSRADISHSDQYAQFAMAAAVQAVEDSGVIGTLPPERIGVYIGTGIGGIQTFMKEHSKLLDKGPRRVSPYFIPMMIANMAAGLIAIRYQCKNTVMPAVTACASGNNALGEAMRAIRHGYADAIIAGGAEATVNEISAAGFTNMQALSLATDPLAACLPFDARRSGFVMGEGAGVLVLEEYEHAKARGARIYAELCGYGSSCDAYHITAPQPRRKAGPWPEAGPGRGQVAARRTGLPQRPRHRHPPERQGGDFGREEGLRRSGGPEDYDQLHQVGDRPHAGGRRGGRKLWPRCWPWTRA